jgi:hypothetical protein
MKIHLRADSVNETHTRITVFIDGVNCGQLCMLGEDAINFHHTIAFSQWDRKREFISTGKWHKEDNSDLSPI